jgi:hypothetical protein
LKAGWPQQVWASRKIDLVAQTFQHFRDGDADLRVDLIDDAGDKQGDAGAHWGEFNMPESL